MKTLARSRGEYKCAADEVDSLRRALDKSYAEWREQARAEWERRHPGPDPSDACVRVRIRRSGQLALTP